MVIEIEHTTPHNKIEDILCSECEGWFSCTYDFGIHKKCCKPKDRSTGKLNPRDLDKVGWTRFKKGNGEWVFSERLPYVIESIRNGNNTIGNYKYWTYGGGKFLARRRMNT